MTGTQVVVFSRNPHMMQHVWKGSIPRTETKPRILILVMALDVFHFYALFHSPFVFLVRVPCVNLKLIACALFSSATFILNRATDEDWNCCRSFAPPSPICKSYTCTYDERCSNEVWLVYCLSSIPMRLIAQCDRTTAGRTNMRRRRARGGNRPPKSAADLDAEMEVRLFLCLSARSSVDIRLVGLYYLECSRCCHHGTRLIPRYVSN